MTDTAVILPCTNDNVVDGDDKPFTVNSADAFLFHTPYCKLVQKSLARLVLNDFLSDSNPNFVGPYAGLEAFRYVLIYAVSMSVITTHRTPRVWSHMQCYV